MDLIKDISKSLLAEAYSVDYEGSDTGENDKKTHRYRVSHTDPTSKEKKPVGNYTYHPESGDIKGALHGHDGNFHVGLGTGSKENWPKDHNRRFNQIAHDIYNHHQVHLREQEETQIKKPFSKLNALIERKNENGDQEFQTFRGWVRAVKLINLNAVINGDKDIASVAGIGEWDGAKGIIFNPTLRAKFAEKAAATAAPLNLDPITEISKKTLASYVKKSADDLNDQAFSAGWEYGQDRKGTKVSSADKKAERRKAGMKKATDKMVKESLLEGYVTEGISTYNDFDSWKAHATKLGATFKDQTDTKDRRSTRANVAGKKKSVGSYSHSRNSGSIFHKKSLSERTLTSAEQDRKENIVKKMKKHTDSFENNYGDKAKNVMYATATKMAKESTEPTDENILNEARAVSTSQFIQALKQIPLVDKIVDVHFTTRGSTALIRLKDGNAVEVNVTAAHMGDYHQNYTKPEHYKARTQKSRDEARKRWGWDDVLSGDKSKNTDALTSRQAT